LIHSCKSFARSGGADDSVGEHAAYCHPPCALVRLFIVERLRMPAAYLRKCRSAMHHCHATVAPSSYLADAQRVLHQTVAFCGCVFGSCSFSLFFLVMIAKKMQQPTRATAPPITPPMKPGVEVTSDEDGVDGGGAAGGGISGGVDGGGEGGGGDGGGDGDSVVQCAASAHASPMGKHTRSRSAAPAAVLPEFAL